MKNIGEIKNGAADLILAPKPKQDKSIRQTKPRRRYTYSAAVRRGERHPFSRLTEVQVRQIKERFASPVYMKQFNSQLAAWDEIAKEYGVSMACISHIHAERTWRHVQVAWSKSHRKVAFLMGIIPMPDDSSYNKKICYKIHRKYSCSYYSNMISDFIFIVSLFSQGSCPYFPECFSFRAPDWIRTSNLRFTRALHRHLMLQGHPPVYRRVLVTERGSGACGVVTTWL